MLAYSLHYFIPTAPNQSCHWQKLRKLSRVWIMEHGIRHDYSFNLLWESVVTDANNIGIEPWCMQFSVTAQGSMSELNTTTADSLFGRSLKNRAFQIARSIDDGIC
jgi:hypothetical protein